MVIGSDHRGYKLKAHFITWLESKGFVVEDAGPKSPDAADYPDYALAVARKVVAGVDTWGILICSNGVGMAMTANKVKGIRAALCCTPAMADQSRRHNNANVLCLGADNQSMEAGLEILESWLKASFEGGRHEKRVQKMMAAERLCD
ncbi:MAG: ribose 5-phosphate isomerase B [Candidatus Eisenbacteria bacterium]|uniref:Ribose 5-phosphate isomerase B n=1 Tax=Eiseniibacteriota bacterium TaxID=2212470 RepID=A0A948RWY2_UNCEI|nr:ribose 5-phosphate isomerase B [Candidatus Eisenbacteria bacterium]MBU1951088.1 ribose 5-phosphate isomerase B [Candidatus Eisenbacteria bacterium]MBU2690552.1 ribose 5-phosphate isomerase B [Candidatus Eisenbacteria bacterium]